jgi:hypothetical protein
MDRMKARDVTLILKEPYYENKNPELVARETGARVVELPNQPQAGQDYFAFLDSLVERVAGAAAGTGSGR